MSLFLMIICWSLITSSCVFNSHPTFSHDVTEENWQQALVTRTDAWLNGASPWFLARYKHLPNKYVVYPTTIKMTNFTGIVVNGDFQLRILGCQSQNTLRVEGPAQSAQHIVAGVQGHTLYITQSKDAPPNMHDVVVYVTVHELNQLMQMGCGCIEAIGIRSRCLSIITTSTSGGNIWLSDVVNVMRINKLGGSSIYILNAKTPDLKIRTDGRGAVKVSGKIGVSHIEHHGFVDINIVGANSNGLNISADGGGTISIVGPHKLKTVKAHHSVCIFAYPVLSRDVCIYLYDNAQIGLAGRVGTLNVDAWGNTQFLGRSLCTEVAYVRAHDRSHVNVNAGRKIFASAYEKSNIYFYGSRDILTSFVAGNGVVIPIWGYTGSFCAVPTPVYEFAREKVRIKKRYRSPMKPGEG